MPDSECKQCRMGSDRENDQIVNGSDVYDDPDTKATLRKLALIHKVNSMMFWLAMPLVICGAGLGILVWEPIFYLAGLGFGLAGLVVLQTFLVYPFLRCPRCGHRFFLPDRLLGYVAKISPFQDACIHCGLELRQETPAAPNGKL